MLACVKVVAFMCATMKKVSRFCPRWKFCGLRVYGRRMYMLFQNVWNVTRPVCPSCIITESVILVKSIDLLNHSSSSLNFQLLVKFEINFLACWNSNTKFNSFEFKAYQRLHLIFWSRQFFEHQIWSNNWKNFQTSNVCSDKGHSLHFFPCVSLCRVNYSQSIST